MTVPPADAAEAVARLAEHGWPPRLLTVLDRLRQGGGRALVVGGSVRDALLGRPPAETLDVATSLPPGEVLRRFSRVEPTGLRHGTVLILEDGLRIECTTFRREGRYVDARRPETVTFTQDPETDLARRDLTINAMAFDPSAGRLLDPHGGLADLRAGVLRAVGDPLERFREDALRPLRVARFAATLEMTPEPATRAALGAALDRSDAVAAERVREELVRLLTARRPSRGFLLMEESGMLERWLPELHACAGVRQNRFHAHDVLLHSLLTCDAAREDRSRVRWAALLHDIGKPAARVERQGGEATFYGHEKLGAAMAHVRLDALRFPRLERDAIVHLIREHMFDFRPEWTDATLRRWLRRVTPEAVEDLLLLRAADAVGSGVAREASRDHVLLEERLRRVQEDAMVLRVSDLAVDGKDVMRVLGIGPGPRVGRVLDRLLEEVLDDPASNERSSLLRRIAAWRDESPREGPEP